MASRIDWTDAEAVLLKYAPGDTIAGESFTRSTSAYYFTTSGFWALAGINVKRDDHWAAGDGKRSTLLEGAGLNGLLWSQDFANAAWTKSQMTVTGGVTDPAGGATAQRLTATGNGAQALQNLGASTSFVRTNSLWIRRHTGSGNVRLIAPDSSFSAPLGLPAGVWSSLPASVTGAASTGRIHGIDLATSGDAVEVWGAQLEDGPFPTSYIPTTTAAVARGGDFYSLPAPPPQEMSLYMKAVELGTVQVVSGRLFQISSASPGGSPHLIAFAPAGPYRIYHDAGAGAVFSTLAAAPARGDVNELVAHLFGDGSVDALQSINAGAIASAARSAATPLAGAWSGPLVWLASNGSAGTEHGFAAIQSFKIVAGVRSLAEMRAVASTISFSNGKATPLDRFANWNPMSKPVGPAETALGTGRRYVFPFRTDHTVSFEVRHIPNSLLWQALRLQDHLLRGGTVSVNTGDSLNAVYATCCLAPDSTPQITMSDAQELEYTLSVTLLNVASNPFRMLAVY